MILSILLIAFFIMILFTAIAGKRSRGFSVYEIKKGQHYSRKDSCSFIRARFKWGFSKSSIRFSFVFGEGCDYDTSKMGVDRHDINKLYGISFGFDPHYNSTRIGWKYVPETKKIELYLYSYVTGKRKIEKLTQVNIYEQIYCTMFLNKSNGRVIVEIKEGDKVLSISFVEKIQNSWVKFRMFPYFGGNLEAPNDMKIFIKDE